MEHGLLTQPAPLPFDLPEQERLYANPDALPDEFSDEVPDVYDELGQALRVDAVQPIVTIRPTSVAKPITRTPTLHQFLKLAQKDNPGMPRSRLATYWNETYGHVDL